MNQSMTKAQRAAAIEQDPRWACVKKRSAEADGTFYYSVDSTGVYCRPSCAARLARPQNVRFHATRSDAEIAGFRPCKRCKPDQLSLNETHAARIAEACRFIEESLEAPTLEQLAERAGLSRYHFHRVFKAATGITPNAYAMSVRANRLRKKLDATRSVTDAIYESGFNSSSRFYEKSTRMLGMTPSTYRKGGTRTDILFAVGECSLGSILVAASRRGVCAILLGDHPEALVLDLQDQFPQARLIGSDKQFEQLIARVVGFVEAPSISLDLPLDIRGTAFQQRVWEALRQIRPGTTVTYAQLAGKIGRPGSARAVGKACGSNLLAVAIPCHRVVRKDGLLSGYRWGVERKRQLLEREAKTRR